SPGSLGWGCGNRSQYPAPTTSFPSCRCFIPKIPHSRSPLPKAAFLNLGSRIGSRHSQEEQIPEIPAGRGHPSWIRGWDGPDRCGNIREKGLRGDRSSRKSIQGLEKRRETGRGI
uniref:Uncharacterized protein n=1 Tax=Cyanoderma ruficeps TaxID=181631 RepID=A0A8C3NZC0_9PASS